MGVMNRRLTRSDRGAIPLLGCWQLEHAAEPAEAEYREADSVAAAR